MTSISGLVVFTLFFVVTARMLARRDGVFCAFYIVLFVYTFFTQVAWIFYPDGFPTLVPGGVPITDGTTRAYQAFVTASFVGLFFVLWRGIRGPATLRTYQAPNAGGHFAAFIVLVLLYDAVLLWILVYNYGTLSYETPDALKSQTLFARPYVFFGVVFLALYATAARFKEQNNRRRVCQSLMVLSGALILVIAVRAGTRTVLATTTIGVVSFEALWAGNARRLLRPRVLIGAISVFIVLTAIATFRVEGPTNPVNLYTRVSTDVDGFVSTRLSLQAIIYGDYTGPSALLLTSIADGTVIPETALPAVLYGCLPFGGFSGYRSVGYIVARIADPSLENLPWKGFGYYVLTEGYNVAGWFGIFYNAIVIGFALLASRRFWNTPDRFYRAFVGALFATQAIPIVRGQSSEIIRAWYLVMLPGLVFLWLGCGLRVDWSRRSRRSGATSQSQVRRSRLSAAAGAHRLLTTRR